MCRLDWPRIPNVARGIATLRRRWSMRWTQAIGVAIVVGIVSGTAPVAAQPAAPTMLITSLVQPADTSWPAVVPRLSTYSEDQKASITAIVHQYCTQSERPDRAELQTRIQAVLTPEQAIAALRYWIAQDLRRDV